MLHLHKRLDLWLQPGGHIEPGETPWDAARREAHEETGLDVTFAGRWAAARPRRRPPRSPQAHPPRSALPARGTRRHPDAASGREPGGALVPLAQGDQRSPSRDSRARCARCSPDSPRCDPAAATMPATAPRCTCARGGSRCPTVPVVHDDSDVRRWMADEVIAHADVTVAEVDGMVVGLMVLSADAKRRSGWIEQLYLDPAWIGRGLGEQFVDRAKSAHARGPAAVDLRRSTTLRVGSTQRLGFDEVEQTDGAGNEEREPDVRYQVATRYQRPRSVGCPDGWASMVGRRHRLSDLRAFVRRRRRRRSRRSGGHHRAPRSLRAPRASTRSG